MRLLLKAEEEPAPSASHTGRRQIHRPWPSSSSNPDSNLQPSSVNKRSVAKEDDRPQNPSSSTSSPSGKATASSSTGGIRQPLRSTSTAPLTRSLLASKQDHPQAPSSSSLAAANPQTIRPAEGREISTASGKTQPISGKIDKERVARSAPIPIQGHSQAHASGSPRSPTASRSGSKDSSPKEVIFQQSERIRMSPVGRFSPRSAGPSSVEELSPGVERKPRGEVRHRTANVLRTQTRSVGQSDQGQAPIVGRRKGADTSQLRCAPVQHSAARSVELAGSSASESRSAESLTSLSTSENRNINIGIETELHLVEKDSDHYREILHNFVEVLAANYNAKVPQQHPRMRSTIRPYEFHGDYNLWCLVDDDTVHTPHPPCEHENCSSGS
jgi:hypothetical protein